MDTSILRAAASAGIAVYKALPKPTGTWTKGGAKAVLLVAIGASNIGRVAGAAKAIPEPDHGSTTSPWVAVGLTLVLSLAAVALAAWAITMRSQAEHQRESIAKLQWAVTKLQHLQHMQQRGVLQPAAVEPALYVRNMGTQSQMAYARWRRTPRFVASPHDGEVDIGRACRQH